MKPKFKFHCLKMVNKGLNGFRIEWGAGIKYRFIFDIAFSFGFNSYHIGFSAKRHNLTPLRSRYP